MLQFIHTQTHTHIHIHIHTHTHIYTHAHTCPYMQGMSRVFAVREMDGDSEFDSLGVRDIHMHVIRRGTLFPNK